MRWGGKCCGITQSNVEQNFKCYFTTLPYLTSYLFFLTLCLIFLFCFSLAIRYGFKEMIHIRELLKMVCLKAIFMFWISIWKAYAAVYIHEITYIVMSFILVVLHIDLFICQLHLDCNSVKFDSREIPSLYSDNY